MVVIYQRKIKNIENQKKNDFEIIIYFFLFLIYLEYLKHHFTRIPRNFHNLIIQNLFHYLYQYNITSFKY